METLLVHNDESKTLNLGQSGIRVPNLCSTQSSDVHLLKK